MLSEAIEGFVGRRFEDLPDRPSAVCFVSSVGMSLNGRVWLECLAAPLLLLQYDIAAGVCEPYFASHTVDICSYAFCGNSDDVARLAYRVLACASLRHDDEACRVGKLIFGSCRDTEDLVAHHLQTHQCRLSGVVILYGYGDTFSSLGVYVCSGNCSGSKQHDKC